MCILCVIQKWSRKIATMLPWIVIPLIGLWFLSQFFPPAFRFEITSPKLACVLVLLVTLFWYEVLMPRLSTWRARRNARLKERKRLEAIEMQKLRKNAVRKCRNCKTPYRDQNPSGGKFNCSYCGHQSKRPATDPLFVSPDLGRFSISGNLKELVEKVWSDNNWICGQDWLENGGNWVNGSVKSSNCKKNNGGFFSTGNDFFSFVLVFVCKSLAAVFLGFMWLFRKVFRVSFNEDDSSSDSDVHGLAKKGENGVNCNETKSEKARRKAEEKRQARLEREQLEEEERKQREEVARLVEERRKVRDEIDKHINKKDKSSPRHNNNKKEAEKKRVEKKKEWDRGSNKSNSDVDEKIKKVEEVNKSKVVVTNSYNKGGVGTRYLDRMKGSLFGKGIYSNASNTRDRKSSAFLDHSSKRDHVHLERAHGKSNTHADDQNQNGPACFESQPCPPPKRSWHQLFTRSSPTPSSTTTTNVITRPTTNIIAPGYPVTQGFHTPITQGLRSLPTYSYTNSTTTTTTTTTTTGLQLSSNLNECIHEEPEIFQDPCYVPEPASSTGPVSDSFNNFPIDLGFLADGGPEYVSPNEMHAANDDKGWQGWNSKLGPDTLGLFGANPSNTTGFMKATSDDPWAFRTSYGPVPSNNNCLSMNLQIGNAHNKLVYGIPNGSPINYPFQPPHGSVWAKKEQVGAVPGCVEGIGTTSAMISPGGGLYSTPNVQSPWSYEL
ncbi:uncharacterized protein [Rutidosis leptorrhynchoides]|uniref:uncharacterized protein n=1 Tax=Rutidosis leptorrhynchoides TaxID=125765 RepID=UPI003A9A19B1